MVETENPFTQELKESEEAKEKLAQSRLKTTNKFLAVAILVCMCSAFFYIISSATVTAVPSSEFAARSVLQLTHIMRGVTFALVALAASVLYLSNTWRIKNGK